MHTSFFLSEPVAFRRVYGLESYSRTSGESNHHQLSATQECRDTNCTTRTTREHMHTSANFHDEAPSESK